MVSSIHPWTYTNNSNKDADGANARTHEISTRGHPRPVPSLARALMMMMVAAATVAAAVSYIHMQR